LALRHRRSCAHVLRAAMRRQKSWAPPRIVVSGEVADRGRGPETVPRLDRVPDRKTPSLAIGGSAHSRRNTGRTGNTLFVFFGPDFRARLASEATQARCRWGRFRDAVDARAPQPRRMHGIPRAGEATGVRRATRGTAPVASAAGWFPPRSGARMGKSPICFISKRWNPVSRSTHAPRARLGNRRGAWVPATPGVGALANSSGRAPRLRPAAAPWPAPRRSGRPTSGPASPGAAAVPRGSRSRAP
jgi:hypothetical protein